MSLPFFISILIILIYIVIFMKKKAFIHFKLHTVHGVIDHFNELQYDDDQ